ncbi:MAG: DNA polymerase/3'-5' exonuclease PolX [Actinobacteria bacterium]|nr:DNA polymerase/3'-5' exonuclease PolX [Actinomycetota bacterium]
MPRTNDEAARLLNELSVLTGLAEGNPNAFRVRAYQNGARAVKGLGRDISEMSEAELLSVKGIGKAIASKLAEYLQTGTIRKLEELRDKHPVGQRELLRVPGLGPKSVQLLREVLGITDLPGLTAALDGDRLAELPGFGEKTVENLRRGIERFELTSHDRRLPIAQALPVAEELVADLRARLDTDEVVYAGSLRRFRDTIGDIDILVATGDVDAANASVASLPQVQEVLARGDTKTSFLTFDGMQVDVRVVEPGHLGAALVYFTGSKAHNIELRQRAIQRGWLLNEYALTDQETDAIVAASTEEDIYAALDLAWIAPELREGRDEVALAARGELPDLVSLEDIRGDLHDHSDHSGDGRMSLEDLVAAAREHGLQYIAVTDHAEDLRINGVSKPGMLAIRRRLRELQEGVDDIRLLHGAELNIGIDGSLDYDHDFLLTFDWCVASVHSHFRLDPDAQTERVITAMRHPAVNVIGHLTGRRIGKRPGIDLHVDRVLDAAVETGTAIEINSNLDRLDAPDEIIREGVARGVTFVISTDAHAVREFDYLRHGIRQARRGGVPRDRVANTWETERFLGWAGTKRASA